MLKRVIDGRWITANAVLGLYPAHAVNDDDIELYTDESRNEVAMTWHGLRQQTEKQEIDGVMRPSRCLTDFVAPSVSGFYLGHPDSCYFNVGKIADDQLHDLAGRSQQQVADLQRLLAPNL